MTLLTLRPQTDVLAPPAVVWEHVACPMCSSRDEEILCEAADANPGDAKPKVFAVVQCRRCGLSYTNPRPDRRTIGQFYPEDYQPHRRPRKIREAGSASFWSRFTGRSQPERNGELPWMGQGRLLDFGCGGGSYLKRMADQGWQVTGLDAAVGAVRSVQTELGLRAIVGTLPHPQVEPGSFDVVTMWQTIEHVHSPLAILREAFQVLVPGGKLIVACPNADSWAFRHFGPDWFGLDVPRHLTHFTPMTLSAMLVAAGFAIEDLRLVRHADWLRSSAKLASRRGSRNLWHRALTYKPVAKFTAWLTHLAATTDCMLAVAERPTS
ncbi:MAG: class I SAM-dependent methyltransferase [Fimbriiglobus sp.]